MTARTLAALAAAALLLAGCAQPINWTRPNGVTEAQFHKDRLECAMVGKQLVGDSFVMGPPLMIAIAQAAHDNNVKAAFIECMLSKDYVQQTVR